jgi:nucleoside-diphosphate-sugar epimerase
MKGKDIMLLGCGDIGTALGLQLLKQGHRPLAVRRNISALPEQLPGRAIDYRDPAQLKQLVECPCDITVMTATPMGRDEQAYREGFLLPVQNLLQLWQEGPARQLIFVSSTRVYGDCDGAWIDETTALKPADAQARVMVEAESLLLESRHEVSIVRFSGIYGRIPSRLLERLARGEICAVEPQRFSNRIHRDDCIGFLNHLIELPARAPLYLASDSQPVLQREMEHWLMQAMGVSIEREMVTPAMVSRRCNNAGLLASGYQMLYPAYQSGYRDMIISTSMSTALGKAAT